MVGMLHRLKEHHQKYPLQFKTTDKHVSLQTTSKPVSLFVVFVLKVYNKITVLLLLLLCFQAGRATSYVAFKDPLTVELGFNSHFFLILIRCQ